MVIAITMKRFFSTLLLILSAEMFAQENIDDLTEIALKNPNLIESLQNDLANEIEAEIKGEDKSIDTLDIKITEEVSEDAEQKKFGFDFISSIPTSISSTSDLPVPNDYLISIGDKIKIILTGGKNTDFELEVGMDGAILFPEIGQLNVYGKSISEVQKSIDKVVQLSFVGTKSFVSLVSLSARKINVLGAVKSPGTYIVNPFSTISSALAYSGGFEEYASLRTITLIRNGEETQYDLYDLLINGNRAGDINVQQGDTILVKSTSNFINISGEVNRPLIYEYVQSDSISDLIQYSMGLKPGANPNNISLIDYVANFTGTQINELKSSDETKISDFNSPFQLEIFKIVPSSSLNIRVTGPIENQGYFNIDNKYLSDLMEKVKISDSIYPYLAVVQKDNFTKLFSVSDKETQNIELEDNFEIIFFSKYENILQNNKLSENTKKLISDYMLSVSILGENIDFPLFGKTTAKEVSDYLGFDIDSFSNEKTIYLSPLANKIIIGNFNEISFKAERYNSLTFRDLIDKTISVSLTGEVKFPGNYVLKPNTSLSELYRIANGYTDSADRNAVIFLRESIKESNIKSYEKAKDQITNFFAVNPAIEGQIDPRILELVDQEIDDDIFARLSGDLSIDSENIDNFLLEDGDSIFIPKRQMTVSVFGEVLNPSSFIFTEGLSVSDLVELSGGYTQLARKRSVYVIRSNGYVVKSSGIFSENIRIEPGDTVVVPLNINANTDILSIIAPVTSVLSNLAFAAAALENLNR